MANSICLRLPELWINFLLFSRSKSSPIFFLKTKTNKFKGLWFCLIILADYMASAKHGSSIGLGIHSSWRQTKLGLQQFHLSLFVPGVLGLHWHLCVYTVPVTMQGINVTKAKCPERGGIRRETSLCFLKHLVKQLHKCQFQQKRMAGTQSSGSGERAVQLHYWRWFNGSLKHCRL